jgi:hypothetical protein
MTAGNGKTSPEAEIRALIDDQAKAIRAKDIDGSVFGYAPDVLLFDVINPLQSTGSDAARAPPCPSTSRAVEPRWTSSPSRRRAPSGRWHPHEEGWSHGKWKR